MTIEAATGPIREAVAQSVAEHALTLVVGGNNAVTRPAVLALGELDSVGLITLDAHFDMRDTNEGLEQRQPGAGADRGRAAGPQHRPGRPRQLRQHRRDAQRCCVGRQLRGDDRGGAAPRHRPCDRPGARACRAIAPRWSIDCDIDVIDRAQFPAAPGGRPGGMTALDFFRAVRRLAGERRTRVIDLTEWDPPLDPHRPQRADRRPLAGGVRGGLRSPLTFWPSHSMGEGWVRVRSALPRACRKRHPTPNPSPSRGGA